MFSSPVTHTHREEAAGGVGYGGALGKRGKGKGSCRESRGHGRRWPWDIWAQAKLESPKLGGIEGPQHSPASGADRGRVASGITSSSGCKAARECETAGTRDRWGSARFQQNRGTKMHAELTRVPCVVAEKGQAMSAGRWAFECGWAGRCHGPKGRRRRDRRGCHASHAYPTAVLLGHLHSNGCKTARLGGISS